MVGFLEQGLSAFALITGLRHPLNPAKQDRASPSCPLHSPFNFHAQRVYFSATGLPVGINLNQVFQYLADKKLLCKVNDKP